MRVTRIIPEVRSRDLAETREFFGGLLGLVVNDNVHPNLPPGFAINIDDPMELECRKRDSTVDLGQRNLNGVVA